MPSPAPLKILLVDDEPLARSRLRELLADIAQQVPTEVVAEAGNGLIALEILREKVVDVVLADIRMPVMDGCKATAAIRGLNRADAAAIPILAMMADAFEEDFHRTKEAGMNGHITKPIDPERLFKTLRENIKMC